MDSEQLRAADTTSSSSDTSADTERTPTPTPTIYNGTNADDKLDPTRLGPSKKS